MIRVRRGGGCVVLCSWEKGIGVWGEGLQRGGGLCARK